MTDTNRQAIDTIRGYLYQFDNTILRILNNEDENSIFTIEGIEDIDIDKIDGETIAIQCKYYEKSDFVPSIIKEAITWMVKDFSDRISKKQELIQYKLFGHYKSGQEKLSQPISVDYLKQTFLTTKTQKKEDKPFLIKKIHEDLGLNDDDLKLFLKKLTIDINAPSLEQQYLNILEKLCESRICTVSDADFFYAKSIYIIRNLAKNQIDNQRKITKKKFIEQLKNSKKMVFDYWFFERLDMDKYCKKIRKKYFNNTQTNMNRFFLIEATGLEIYELKDILKNISDRWSNLETKNQPERFCPFIYLHNIKNEDLIKLKTELIVDEYLIEDGYYFKDSLFNSKLYLRSILEHGNPYRTKIKFINNIEDLSLILSKPLPRKQVFQIYTNSPYFEVEESFDVYIRNIECLKEILCGK
ncbi:DUF4297 family anti-phage-associated protein [Acinetobacter sp. TGL-Y2]|uniref:DUF4297 family anti-phage-associated protein n=1 Tax=Acinetobacter sp. TGL-Y2 TaxID=1407071 RepID=UPI0019035A82|nr:DUF4297 family anti-phage-associated protein [Acinetobacter sp. TGL-Y2]MBJ9371313.1 hypothetical protein [Acinetobacter sp. TGL-Y2]